MKKFIIGALLMAVPFTTFAQLKVYRNGDITIGRTGQSEVSKLAVGGTITTRGVIIPITDWQQQEARTLSEEEILPSIMSMDVIAYGHSADEESASAETTPLYYAISPATMQQLYPTLVCQENDTIKGINYTALIPLLVRSIQELQHQVQELKNNVDMLSMSQTMSDTPIRATLSQNSPNPSRGQTSINYSIEGDFSTAFIRIADIYGGVVKTIPLQQSTGSIDVSTSELSPGLYLYTLIVDGIAADNKKMTVVR